MIKQLLNRYPHSLPEPPPSQILGEIVAREEIRAYFSDFEGLAFKRSKTSGIVDEGKHAGIVRMRPCRGSYVANNGARIAYLTNWVN